MEKNKRKTIEELEKLFYEDKLEFLKEILFQLSAAKKTAIELSEMAIELSEALTMFATQQDAIIKNIIEDIEKETQKETSTPICAGQACQENDKVSESEISDAFKSFEIAIAAAFNQIM